MAVIEPVTRAVPTMVAAAATMEREVMGRDPSPFMLRIGRSSWRNDVANTPTPVAIAAPLVTIPAVDFNIVEDFAGPVLLLGMPTDSLSLPTARSGVVLRGIGICLFSACVVTPTFALPDGSVLAPLLSGLVPDIVEIADALRLGFVSTAGGRRIASPSVTAACGDRVAALFSLPTAGASA